MPVLQPAGSGNGIAVPNELLPYGQFVPWKLEQRPGKAKPDKVPYNPVTGAPASTTDPATWGTYAEAVRAFQRGGFDGIGFVFTAADPFVFVDLDNCADQPGSWKVHARALMQALPGAWEASQSGHGLHGIGITRDKTALAHKRRKWHDAECNAYECYISGRFIAIGGRGWVGNPVHDWTDALVAWLPDRTDDHAQTLEWIDQARPGYCGPVDDDALIAQMLASRGGPAQMLGRAPSAAALWNADPLTLGAFYPDGGGQGRAFDHSAADLALMNALAWWTGCNPSRMERIFNRSALARGDARKTRLSVETAIADPNRTYLTRDHRRREDQWIGDDIGHDALPKIITLDHTLYDFVFIANGSLVVNRSTKTVRSYTDAANEYAASIHYIGTGKMDSDGKPVLKSVPVMKIWRESDQRKTRDIITWAPGESEFCDAIEHQQAGSKAYNLFTSLRLLPAPTDWQQRVQPFLQHMDYLVPIEAERSRFTHWIAHIFQKPGELPHTGYLMIATQTGIGRGTLASILTRALRGHVAANVDADILFSGGFNGRMSQKLLVTIDEIREGHSSNRYSKAETMKSKMTEETRALNPKYGAQSIEKNCCRWLMFSNHMDAIPFDNNDRRLIVIENPTQRAQPEWYSYLHTLLHDTQFIASVQKYFCTLDISSFNPHDPAPLNDAKKKALGALESDCARSIRQFREEWPGDLATIGDLRTFLTEDAPGTSRAMRHEIERAGMRVAHKAKINGRTETLLIVRGPLWPVDLRAVDNASLAAAIIKSRMQWA